MVALSTIRLVFYDRLVKLDHYSKVVDKVEGNGWSRIGKLFPIGVNKEEIDFNLMLQIKFLTQRAPYIELGDFSNENPVCGVQDYCTLARANYLTNEKINK